MQVNKTLVVSNVAIAAASIILTLVFSAPSDIETLDACAKMPAQQLREAASTTVNQIKDVNDRASILNARKQVILSIQDANS